MPTDPVRGVSSDPLPEGPRAGLVEHRDDSLRQHVRVRDAPAGEEQRGHRVQVAGPCLAQDDGRVAHVGRGAPPPAASVPSPSPRGPGHDRRWHAAARCPRSGGSNRRQTSSTSGQRGLKAQPTPSRGRVGHLTLDHRLDRRRRRGSGTGTASRSASVYGCSGRSMTAFQEPGSTTRPRYITATRSDEVPDHRHVVADEQVAESQLARAAGRAGS